MEKIYIFLGLGKWSSDWEVKWCENLGISLIRVKIWIKSWSLLSLLSLHELLNHLCPSPAPHIKAHHTLYVSQCCEPEIDFILHIIDSHYYTLNLNLILIYNLNEHNMPLMTWEIIQIKVFSSSFLYFVNVIVTQFIQFNIQMHLESRVENVWLCL